MKLYLPFIFLVLPGCAVSNSFKVGSLDCTHVVSTQLMGTAQVVECEQDKMPAYVNSFPGTPAIDPLEKAAELGAALGALRNLPSTLSTDSVIHLKP